MSRVLLFGAGGFLGRHIHGALASHSMVLAPDRWECDLVGIELSALVALLRREKPDAVVTAAGRISGSGYDFVQAHVATTAKLIEAVAAGAPQARLVRIGSAAEYGAVPHGSAVTEDHPASPVGEYGLSHLTATRLAQLAGESARVDTVVLRVFNPVGPGMPAGNVLGRAATLIRTALARGEERVSLGLLSTYRDFVDVRDVADAVLAAIRSGPLAERIFNVGSGRAVATREAIGRLAEVAGFTGEVGDGSLAPDAGRSAAVPWMCADIGRSARALGWAPRHTLTASLMALWQETAAGRPTPELVP
ncbi:NAD-dependent epimerase/dehydratase family protein [Micromonospora sp. L31]|uniref:NAD-dependent epimerase/dehydratase family protein n=1 Tax=Micromonospora sp. L31 TaxID=3452213 RepID=UPI003F88E3CF